VYKLLIFRLQNGGRPYIQYYRVNRATLSSKQTTKSRRRNPIILGQTKQHPWITLVCPLDGFDV
jgi:hypothetical protein